MFAHTPCLGLIAATALTTVTNGSVLGLKPLRESRAYRTGNQRYLFVEDSFAMFPYSLPQPQKVFWMECG